MSERPIDVGDVDPADRLEHELAQGERAAELRDVARDEHDDREPLLWEGDDA